MESLKGELTRAQQERADQPYPVMARKKGVKLVLRTPGAVMASRR
jgi:hypothetical protein